MKKITEENFTLYAAKYYLNANCIDEQEFIEDLNRIKYIKRLLTQYKKTGKIKTHLILNHLIILYNVFETKPMTSMLIFKLPEYISSIKTFLIYLQRWPTRDIINDSEISIDYTIVENLRNFDARKV